MNRNLHKYFLNNNSKIVHKWNHYLDIYEKHFEPFIDREITMFEIGVFEGGSLNMWKYFFGEKCKIVGIDINPDCKKHEDISREIYVEIGDQSDIDFLKKLITKYGKPDIVLDDGSHVMNHLVTTFNFLYFNMQDEGVYLAEDLHTCYWPEYGGGLGSKSSFIEFTKTKIDELNSNYTRGELPITDFTKNTMSISLYDSVAVFEKRKQQNKFHIQIGDVEKFMA